MAKQFERARAAVADELELDESVELLLFGTAGPGSLLRATLLTAFTRRSKRWRLYWVELTDRRVFVVGTNPLTGRPANVEWRAPRAAVQVDRYEPGGFRGKLFLRRVTDGYVLNLHFAHNQRDAALAVKAALGG
ncbi:MAG: hypothetical protein ACREOA_03020 [Candidatus Dormibacteria bacterium]